MRISGTIYPDGRVQYHGYERMDSRLLSVNSYALVIHHAGGRYWDNSGGHYVAAHVEVVGLEYLRPGNEEGTWQFGLGLGPKVASYHPTPKVAAGEAVRKLEMRGEEIVAAIEKRKNADG